MQFVNCLAKHDADVHSANDSPSRNLKNSVSGFDKNYAGQKSDSQILSITGISFFSVCKRECTKDVRLLF